MVAYEPELTENSLFSLVDLEKTQTGKKKSNLFDDFIYIHTQTERDPVYDSFKLLNVAMAALSGGS